MPSKFVLIETVVPYNTLLNFLTGSDSTREDLVE